MARPLHQTPGGLVYHVVNRASARATIFHHAGDYAAFTTVLAEALAAGGQEPKSFLNPAPP
jgi:putative transposase